MIRAFAIFSFLLLVSFTLQAQIKGDTLYYNQNEIRIYTYLLDNDTIVKAYFDKDVPRVIKKVSTNLGKKKKDLTFDSIYNFVRAHYPSSSLTSTDLHAGALMKFEENPMPDFKSAISRDSYLIDAINYFSTGVEKDTASYWCYYELAKTYDQFYTMGSMPYHKVISYLDTCIQLNPGFEKAYLLKAKIHESNARLIGLMKSDPHVHIADSGEIKRAEDCLDQLLKINPENKEGIRYLRELKDKYGSRM